MKKPHKYRDLTTEEHDELFSNYLLDNWSYSKVNTFSRNEKAYEMSYIYMEPFRMSATSIAGSAYHSALLYYFSQLQAGEIADIVELEAIAYEYIDDVEACKWKLQKTTPTIQACKDKATKTVSALLNNFFGEISVYLGELEEVLATEQTYFEFLTVNGVDIPLPCKGVIDLVIKTKDNKRVIIDHKSKASFSDDQEVQFTIGKQAITYVLLYEAATGEKIDEVWFIENKTSKNRDGSPQLIAFKVVMDDDTRVLYQSMLYEPLKRMLEAISDPDYVYLINENDNFVDKAEIYEFWSKTMMAEIDDFNIPENKKDLLEKRIKRIRDASISIVSPNVIKKFRANAAEFIKYDLSNKDMTREQKIEHILRSLGLTVNVEYTFKGYSSDTFLVSISAGTSISTITRYKLDIASALSVSSVRISKDLFVHEGRSFVSIEAENKANTTLRFDKSLLDGRKIPLGIDNFGNTVRWDIDNPSTPHVLVGGSTGSGKSVFLISTIKYAQLAGIKRVIIFDPKFEFVHFSSPDVEVYSDIEDIETMMEGIVEEMNSKVKSGGKEDTLIVFDEFADAVANSTKGSKLNVYKDVEVGFYADGRVKTKREVVDVKKSLSENLRVLLQKGRSSGYRVISATQRASVKVVTGDTKVNFPVQICFKVPKEVDSKVMIDESGAEALKGKGDGLLKSPEYGITRRFQAFLS